MSNWYETYLEKTARHGGAEKERSIWYHGTKESNLPKILSQGLIITPKQRLWDESEHEKASFLAPSQASLEGVYVTRNLLTARLSAQHKLAKGEKRVIVMMELQPRSLVADEDNLTHYVKSVLNNPKYGANEWEIAEIYMYKINGFNQDYLDRVKTEYIKTGLNLLEQYYGPLDSKLRDRIRDLLDGAWDVVLVRQAAHIEDYNWNNSFYRNLSEEMRKMLEDKRKELSDSGIDRDRQDELYSKFVESVKPKKPNVVQAESQYLAFMDQLTRTMKSSARPLRSPQKAEQMTARATENIGFKGSNRIICIVKVDEDYGVEIVYGELPDDFKHQWKETTGELRITKQPQQKVASGTNLIKTSSKAIWYHGTLMINYQNVISQGLLANPPTRLWGKEDMGDSVAPSKASYPGIYLTQELIDALEAPDNALDAMDKKNPDNSMLLAIVQADTQSLFVDEDAMAFNVSVALESVSDFLACYVYISGVTQADIMYFNRLQEKFVMKQTQDIDKKFNLGHTDMVLRVQEILKEGFISALTRQVSHADPDKYKKAYDDLAATQRRMRKEVPPMPPQPSEAKGEEMFRQLMEQLTRTLKFSKYRQNRENVRGEWWDSGRYPNNITFRGSTKILALVQIFVRSKSGGYIPHHYYQYKVLYGQLPEQFLTDWKEIIQNSQDADGEKRTDEEEVYEKWFNSLPQY